MIDVSELVNDSDFAQSNGITITRTTLTIVNHLPVESKEELKVEGIITIANENEDELLAEADRNKEQIHIFTYKRLKTVGIDKLSGVQYGADIVHFNGAKYKVAYCLDDAQYGFCRSTAIKLEQEVM